MLNIFTMDSDRWITEGLRLYFSGQMISCLTLTSPDDPLPTGRGRNVVISELHFASKNLEETLRSLLLMQLKTPGVELVILTDISDEAVLNYVARHLKKARILSKKCPLATLVSAVLTPENVAAVAAPHGNADVLTEREFTLLRWLAGPRRMTEIGHALHLSNKTISHYKNTISRKLGCKNHMDFYHRLTSYGF
ncbi:MULTISPECIES: LuxR C-terminal-related transcriptional regulator [unclassified Pantoea]|uniref:response regulator transcription factor n=1 Tax=unclassified Pantoea TaxID=2630326 RepID=UPI001232D23E|nr:MULTISPECIES: LuxR C-terminal-related transcriptional regulator [unclassified Pantoea]KAA6103693.1 response regulator transcription factor [Pantoea sp. B_9]KAA6116657.1 response regulator transcription factor [Pantoea sp. B_10]